MLPQETVVTSVNKIEKSRYWIARSSVKNHARLERELP